LNLLLACKATRITNLLERLFGEERRRTKRIPHEFGKRPGLEFAYAPLIRAADSWRGVKVIEFEIRQLHTLREDFQRLHRAYSICGGDLKQCAFHESFQQRQD
jgi:hypothetical protein